MLTPSVNRNTKEKAHYLRRLAELAIEQNRSLMTVCPWPADLAFIEAYKEWYDWWCDMTVEESAMFALFVAEFLDTDGAL